MGPQTGTPTDLGAKSYAPLNLNTSGARAGDKGAPGPGAAMGPSEWPLGPMSGPLVARVAPMVGLAPPSVPRVFWLVVPPLSPAVDLHHQGAPSRSNSLT
ncbi:unnamed protein product [Calypogeia fissa]